MNYLGHIGSTNKWKILLYKLQCVLHVPFLLIFIPNISASTACPQLSPDLNSNRYLSLGTFRFGRGEEDCVYERRIYRTHVHIIFIIVSACGFLS